MTDEIRIVVPDRPPTSDYVAFDQSTTSQYVSYAEESSLIPSSFDQIAKNGVVHISAAREAAALD